MQKQKTKQNKTKKNKKKKKQYTTPVNEGEKLPFFS